MCCIGLPKPGCETKYVLRRRLRTIYAVKAACSSPNAADACRIWYPPRAGGFYLPLTGEVPRRGGGREEAVGHCRMRSLPSGRSDSARQSRRLAEQSEACPISPSAAPPQLPRQEELRPAGAAERAGVPARDAGRAAQAGWTIRILPYLALSGSAAAPPSGGCRCGGTRRGSGAGRGAYCAGWRNNRNPVLSLPQRLRRSSPVRRS